MPARAGRRAGAVNAIAIPALYVACVLVASRALAADGGVAQSTDLAVTLADGATIKLDVDQHFFLRVPHLRQVASTCAQFAMVRTLGNDVVGMAGVQQGECALTITDAAGVAHAYPVAVKGGTSVRAGPVGASANPKDAAAATTAIARPEHEETKPSNSSAAAESATGSTSAKNPWEIELPEGGFAEVTVPEDVARSAGCNCCADEKPIGRGFRRYRIEGVAAGKCTLMFWAESGKRFSYLVTVHDRDEARAASGETATAGVAEPAAAPAPAVALGEAPTLALDAPPTRVEGCEALARIEWNKREPRIAIHGKHHGHCVLHVWTASGGDNYDIDVSPEGGAEDPPPTKVTEPQPLSPPCADLGIVPDEAPITLPPGGCAIVHVPGVARIAISMGVVSVCDPIFIGGDQVRLRGAGEGKTTLLMWKGSGAREAHLITVRDGASTSVSAGTASGTSSPAAEAGPSSAKTTAPAPVSPPCAHLGTLPPGATIILPLDGCAIVHVPKVSSMPMGMGQLSICNPTFVGGDDLRLQGVSEGKAMLHLMKKGGTSEEHLVVVGAGEPSPRIERTP